MRAQPSRARDLAAVRRGAAQIRWSLDPYTHLSLAADRIHDTAAKQEREHRAMGRRMGQGLAGLPSVLAAADLFMVRTLAAAVRDLTVGGRGRRLRKTVAVGVLTNRDDYVLACRLVASDMALERLWSDGHMTPRRLVALAELADYSRLIAGEGE